MGSRFQNYFQAQIEAERYAVFQRRLSRYSKWYLAVSLLSTLITLLVTPRLFIPSFIFSTTVYALVRFGSYAYNDLRKRYFDYKAAQAVRKENGGSEDTLLSSHTRSALRTIANEGVQQAIQKKKKNIALYGARASLTGELPSPYSDLKHSQNLRSYYLLRCAQEAGLQGDEHFIDELAHDKKEHRERKIELLEKISEYLSRNTVSISMTVSGARTESCCVITGQDADSLMRDLEAHNQYGAKPFLTVPAGQTQSEMQQFLTHSLLPLLLDKQEILKRPPRNPVLRTHYYHYIVQQDQHFDINAEYVQQRIRDLRKPRTGVLDTFRL